MRYGYARVTLYERDIAVQAKKLTQWRCIAFPLLLGLTTQVILRSNSMTVGSAKDLNP